MMVHFSINFVRPCFGDFFVLSKIFVSEIHPLRGICILVFPEGQSDENMQDSSLEHKYEGG